MVKLLRAIAAAAAKSFQRERLQTQSAESNGEADEITIPLAPLPPAKRALSQDDLFRAAGAPPLSVPHFHQREFSWCYAACGQMILKAYQIGVDQCEIVTEVKKNPLCCDLPVPSDCVRRGADHDDIAPIYISRKINAVHHPGILPLDELQDILRDKRPVEITRRYKEQPDSFHAVVIKGFKDDMLFINDPDFVHGEPYSYDIPYDILIAGDHFTWDDSWIGFPQIQ